MMDVLLAIAHFVVVLIATGLIGLFFLAALQGYLNDRRLK